jgi:glycine reductase
MKLTVDGYPVSKVEWGAKTAYSGGKLTLDKEELLGRLETAGCLRGLEIAGVALVDPDSDTRIINIFDVMPAYVRKGPGASTFPGFLGPMQTVGSGQSAELQDFSVVAISDFPSLFNKLMDKTGPGNDISPYKSHCHLTFHAKQTEETMSLWEYHTALRRIGLTIGAWLAGKAAETTAPEQTVYELTETPDDLPRVVFICQLAALQYWNKGEPILYGNDLANMVPTILHPNEFIDTGVIACGLHLNIDTLSFQNNPIIRELYKRHGIEVNFAGVIAVASHATRQQREFSVQMAVKLACDVLHADLAILTKVGGGIPESDVMMTIDGLEKRGVKTVGTLWGHESGSMNEVLTAFSPKADALVTVGLEDGRLKLPALTNVIGGTEADFLRNNPNEGTLIQKASGELDMVYSNICGAIDQLGAGSVSFREV